jgi:hypothetical protein
MNDKPTTGEPKLDYEGRQEVNRLMEEAQDDLEGVLFRLVAALAAEREKREAWETAYKQAFDVGQQLREQLAADTSDQMKAQLAIEIGLIRSVLSTLIQWLAQSATGVISISDAKSLLEKLDSINK